MPLWQAACGTGAPSTALVDRSKGTSPEAASILWWSNYRWAVSWDLSGDLPSDELRAALHRAGDLAADYLEGSAAYPILPRTDPRMVARSLPEAPLAEQDRLNERLVTEMNADGRFFLSHTVPGGRVTPRVAIGHLRTTERHLDELWELLRAIAGRLRGEAAAQAAEATP